MHDCVLQANDEYLRYSITLKQANGVSEFRVFLFSFDKQNRPPNTFDVS